MPKALVIDDSKATRSILGRMLTEMGFEVHQAGDGAQALSKLKEVAPVNVALIDWDMPVMNGFEFLKAVRSQPGYKDVRLMMVTTESAVHQIARALEAGADEYLMKPFTPALLRQKLSLMGLVSPTGTALTE